MQRRINFARLGTVCRLGLATRGNTSLRAADVAYAVERGINFLNWCAHSDGLSEFVRRAGSDRAALIVAVQFNARSAREAGRELDQILDGLGTDYIDFLTYYYVESPSEWERITGPGGAAEVIESARDDGRVRAIGLTTHQRRLAAEWARSGRLDGVMIRYNAAHRGAEAEVFPVTDELGLPVVAFTAQRWGGLVSGTPEDPPDFTPPPAREWYRFVLAHPSVTVALMAPNGRAELEENLQLLDDWTAPSKDRYASLRAHGERVHRHAGEFW
jgi:predicted aldo/keto reductase-like oxidoreductase